MPKTHYQTSGKIKRIPLIIAITLALPACIWCGKIYGENTAFDISLAERIIAMVIWTGALSLIFYLFRRFNHSRNIKVNVGLGIVFSLSSWITNWVLYQDMEMKGIHLVELVMVALPLSILMMVNYYCEKCKQYYSKTSIYILDAGKFYQSAKNNGDYNFLAEMEPDLKQVPEKGPKVPKEIIKIDFFYCDSCESNSIVDIDSYSWSRKSEHSYWKKETYHMHRTHADSHLSREKGIAQGVYLDATAGSRLKQYLVG